MFKGSRYYSIHSDHLGTPRLMRDDAAKPVWQWSYSAFGDNKPTGILKATTNPNTAITSSPLLNATNPAVVLNFRFPGQYWDSETGLAQNYMREYMGLHGRYTQPDPFGLDGGWNLFGYAKNNPLLSIDPRGLKDKLVLESADYFKDPAATPAPSLTPSIQLPGSTPTNAVPTIKPIDPAPVPIDKKDRGIGDWVRCFMNKTCWLPPQPPAICIPTTGVRG
jgi:RHS repeat-associated protein